MCFLCINIDLYRGHQQLPVQLELIMARKRDQSAGNQNSGQQQAGGTDPGGAGGANHRCVAVF